MEDIDWMQYASVPVVSAAASAFTYLATEFGLPSRFARRFVIAMAAGLFTTSTGFLTDWDWASLFVAFFFGGPTLGLAAIAAYDGINHGSDAVVMSRDEYEGTD